MRRVQRRWGEEGTEEVGVGRYREGGLGGAQKGAFGVQMLVP